MRINQLLIILCVCFYQEVTAQPPANSIRFEVKDYIAQDKNGNYKPYNAHGFYQNVNSNNSAGRIFLMPIIDIELDKIIYIDSQGLNTTSSSTDVRSIEIPIRSDQSLPTESQKVAIGSILANAPNQKHTYPPIIVDNMGFPMINPYSYNLKATLDFMASEYLKLLGTQATYIAEYNKYKDEIISMSEFEVILKVGNDVISSNRYDGTIISMGDALDNISIDYPSEYVKNRIASGNFKVMAKYKFLDTKFSSINASIDANLIIQTLFSESQESTISQRSSGWSFLGFGSRRQSMKSQFDIQINQQYNEQRYENTKVEMFDADEEMIKLFEETFFPVLSKNRAIENHLAAAEKAAVDGKPDMQKLHLDYVKALQENNPNLEVDVAAATAALAKQDYIGFIANGVRWGDYRTDVNSSFRRVITGSEMVTSLSTWNQTKSISIQHSVTQNISIAKDKPTRATLGVIDVIPFTQYLNISNGFSSSLKELKGVALGPIIGGGPLSMGNITAGTFLTKISIYTIDNYETLKTVMAKYQPGESVNITIIEQVGNQLFKEKTVSIKLGSVPKTD